jgi:hypothetical protein
MTEIHRLRIIGLERRTGNDESGCEDRKQSAADPMSAEV